ncbi:SseB family protein [Roseicyclus sp. F158]|uniref:SseB family protein n=1 Tax=Tropicimonas omnivorans TaxID=3075590 RepID=A0ABU3DFB5_9RHOB|nr:SseB family protein [Roseicyclus sp. F158]MDT0682413.1 SseB family protein [Roseicyclus sp. F158]
MSATAIDAAHAAMESAPGDDAARLRFYERLADAELFLLLEKEAEGDAIEPRVFPLEDGPVVLAFDREERLAAFAGPSPYAGMSGRSLSELLAGQGLGLGLNLEVAPSSTLLPASAVSWLAETLAHRPSEAAAQPDEISAPTGLPEALLTALDAKLASAAGLAPMAYLAAVTYEGGARGHLLAFVGAVPGAEPSLARATGEALTFSGIEAGALDVAFFRASDPVAARLARVGLRFDLPKAETPVRAAPGSDPEAPPRLR